MLWRIITTLQKVVLSNCLNSKVLVTDLCLTYDWLNYEWIVKGLVLDWLCKDTDTKAVTQPTTTDKARNYITINTHRHTTIYHHLTIIYQAAHTDTSKEHRRQTQHQGNNTPSRQRQQHNTIILLYLLFIFCLTCYNGIVEHNTIKGNINAYKRVKWVVWCY